MDQFQWQCLGFHPTTWCLGNVLDDIMSNIIAEVHRSKDGAWFWYVRGGESGKQPSRLTAIEAAEQSVQRTRLTGVCPVCHFAHDESDHCTGNFYCPPSR